VDHGLRRGGVLHYLDSLPAVALVTCPFPLIDGQAAVERSDLLAHAACQARRECAGVYLTSNGGLVVRTRILPCWSTGVTGRTERE
jgi:hypothetical protein